MCLLLVKKFLLLMANHIKTLEGRLVSPGYNMRYTNIRAQQLLRDRQKMARTGSEQNTSSSG